MEESDAKGWYVIRPKAEQESGAGGVGRRRRRREGEGEANIIQDLVSRQPRAGAP